MILDDGVDQAWANALANGAMPSDTITITVPPATGPHAGDSEYIEVSITRTVNNWFMPVLGTSFSTVGARAVARCFMPGYGDAALLALDEDNERAIRFDGGGGTSGVSIIGDAVSYGGIDPAGHASHFSIDGSVYAYNGEAADVTTTGGSYGTDTGLSLVEAVDPVVQGQHAQPSPTFRWPHPADSLLTPRWPSNNGCATITGPGGGGGGGTSGGGTPMPTPTPTPVTPRCSPLSITVSNGDTARFTPGVYRGRVTLQGGTSTFAPGIYIFERGLALQGSARATGDGVLFRFDGNGTVVDVAGSAAFTFTAMEPNSWRDIVFYALNGSMDLGGTGDRVLNGGVYVPNGEIHIHGNGESATAGAVINGQVIANTIRFSGNGPAVNYNPDSVGGTFGPILVNTPNAGG